TTPRSGFNIPLEFTIEPFNEKFEYVKQQENQNQHQKTDKELTSPLEKNDLPKVSNRLIKRRIYRYSYIFTAIIIILSI
ncbi:hypothetical protein, partial [Serratia silvae]